MLLLVSVYFLLELFFAVKSIVSLCMSLYIFPVPTSRYQGWKQQKSKNWRMMKWRRGRKRARVEVGGARARRAPIDVELKKYVWNSSTFCTLFFKFSSFYLYLFETVLSEVSKTSATWPRFCRRNSLRDSDIHLSILFSNCRKYLVLVLEDKLSE